MKAEEAFRLTEANAVPWGLVKANGHDGANRVPKSERQAKIVRLMAMGVDVLIIMGPEFE